MKNSTTLAAFLALVLALAIVHQSNCQLIDIKDCPCYTPSMARSSRARSSYGEAPGTGSAGKGGRYSKKSNSQVYDDVDGLDDNDDDDDGDIYGEANDGDSYGGDGGGNNYYNRYKSNKKSDLVSSGPDKAAKRREYESAKSKSGGSSSGRAKGGRRADLDDLDEPSYSAADNKYTAPKKAAPAAKSGSKKLKDLPPKYSEDSVAEPEEEETDYEPAALAKSYGSAQNVANFFKVKNSNANDNKNDIAVDEESDLSSANANSAQMIEEAIKSMLLKTQDW